MESQPSAPGDDDEVEPEFNYTVYKVEGDHHSIRGVLQPAIDNYTRALKIRNNDPNALTARSRCHLKLGNLKMALDDVDLILKEDPLNLQALHQKAETLFSKGFFEMALVFYHRGHLLKPQNEDFRQGIQKSRAAIDNAVGDTNYEISTEGDISFFQKEIEEERLAKQLRKPGGSGSIKRKKVVEEKDLRPPPPKVSNDTQIRRLLGRLYGDRQFLDDVLDEADRKTKTGGIVYDDAWDAIAYLDQRAELWRQERSEPKRLRMNKLRSTAVEKLRINNWIRRVLDRIDKDQVEQKWQESLDRASKLLSYIDGLEPGLVNNRPFTAATVNSYIGNALLELDEPMKALEHFKMERSLADQYNIQESRSRALDSIGRCYVKMGFYKKAIKIWNMKLPLTETPLERSWLYHEMGRCHYELSNYLRAHELGEKALAEAMKAKDSRWLLNASILVAQSLVRLEDYRGALDAFYYALELATCLGDKLTIEAIKRAIDELNKKLVHVLKEGRAEGIEGEDVIDKIECRDVGVQTDEEEKAQRRVSAKKKEDAVSDSRDMIVDDALVSTAESQFPIICEGSVKWVRRRPTEIIADGHFPRRITDQAYVTMATNDVYAVGALVLAHTLRQTATLRHLVVMVTHEVSCDMRALLGQVFDLVFDVWPIFSDDFDNLCLLNRTELGITFTKIHCWRLIQYTKGVFIDADTMVLQNVDDLFDREELSAAPDAGWPDCFNSGVFVFVPSLDTFNRLLEFAKRIGSFDGGDQGLLNLFFDTWATEDISKHLPFTYNLVAHAFYSYQPAYKQYGSQTKIVHFIGTCKPWTYKFDIRTCVVEQAGTLCPHLIQLWWDVFMNNIQHKLTLSMSGLVGQLASLRLHCLGTTIPDWMLERQRQVNWEQNRIDYMGADAFDNIRKRLDEIILGDYGAVDVEDAVDALLGRRDVGTCVPDEWRCECEDTDDSESDYVAREVDGVSDSEDDEPALPPYVLTGQQGERPSQSFIGHFHDEISESKVGAKISSEWQTRHLYPSPLTSPTESKADVGPNPMSRMSWQTLPLSSSPLPEPFTGDDVTESQYGVQLLARKESWQTQILQPSPMPSESILRASLQKKPSEQPSSFPAADRLEHEDEADRPEKEARPRDAKPLSAVASTRGGDSEDTTPFSPGDSPEEHRYDADIAAEVDAADTVAAADDDNAVAEGDAETVSPQPPVGDPDGADVAPLADAEKA